MVGCASQPPQGATSSPIAPLSPAASATAAVSPSPAATSATPGAVSSAEWKDFEGPEGAFKVQFPGEPEVDDPGPDAPKHWTVKSGDATYGIGVTPTHAKLADPKEWDKALDAWATAFSKSLSGEIKGKNPVEVGGVKGIEIELTGAAPGAVKARALLTADGSVLFEQVTLKAPDDQAKKFFDSFAPGEVKASSAETPAATETPGEEPAASETPSEE